MRRSRATAVTRSSGLATIMDVSSTPLRKSLSRLLAVGRVGCDRVALLGTFPSLARLAAGPVAAVVGPDQRGHQRMSHDVHVAELDLADPADAVDELHRIAQTAALTAR